MRVGYLAMKRPLIYVTSVTGHPGWEVTGQAG
jgi:hypothetical protein